MEHLSTTPSVSVTIGRQTRQYFAFVTTAPDVFDSPATITLQYGRFQEVIAFAAGPMPDERMHRMIARLVLVDAMELAWQRAKYLGHRYLFLPADARLAGPNTLQQWLWQRLEGGSASPAAA